MAVRTATRGKLKATRIIEPPKPAAVDVMLGPTDGCGFQRVDVSVTPAPGGGLQIAIAVPGQIGPAVALLLAALGVKRRCSRSLSAPGWSSASERLGGDRSPGSGKLRREFMDMPCGVCLSPLPFDKRLSTAAARTSEKCQQRTSLSQHPTDQS